MAIQSIDTLPSKKQPLVSVIIPAYNAEKFIAKTLESVLAQTYHNIEVIVVDDGSEDRTAQIVQSYMERTSQLKLLSQKNLGVAAARNLGIHQAKGKFIAPLDADDIWYEQNIERQVHAILSAEKNVGLVYSWSIDIDEFGQQLGCVRASRIAGRVYTTLLLHDFIANASSVLIRKDCLDQVGGYDPTLKQQNGQGGEDWDIYLRIAEHYEFRVIPEVLVGYRQLANSMSADSYQMARSRFLIWQKIRQQYPRIPTSIERLSNSSFYLHLADQDYRATEYRTALDWTIKALKIDPLTPFLRLGLYKTVVFFLLSKLSRRAPSVKAIKSYRQIKSKNIHSTSHETLFLQRQKPLFFCQPKFFAELLIHQLASFIFGSSKKWT
ncbi:MULTISPECIES: glycosyltransferase family A protein [Cyanophyceae]|uniref:glycosyltransferase family 2 protein n=1 Tax=Cyanophyceae TaxID=3028117 RepID=UPI001684CB2C|nr:MULTISPECIES: glycosyltransferase family A protein [Cyanophyceae]MBD1918188.1 glycosyltransferase family 2 protein [Phormidium sp. FACHB-77]MBD2030220.1 glycosyltransferase family 2 protein [Phormidium sp. FACHB-322]MBD2051408.1 glycosyltransferase family 2 protein [Leptolyngbya sp. FACHB-60]